MSDQAQVSPKETPGDLPAPPLFHEEMRQAEIYLEDGQRQAAVDVLAAVIGRAVERWEAEPLTRAVLRIEQIGLAPTRVVLVANLLRSHGFNNFCARILNLQPQFSRTRLSHVLTHVINNLRAGYASEEGLRLARQRYAEGLAVALRMARAHNREELAFQFPDSIAAMPFYLAYQGGADRDLQALYGEIVTRIVAASVPRTAPDPPPAPTGRIRLLFATVFCHVHSVMKMCVSWIEQLDRSKFEISFLHLGGVDDSMTERVRRAVDHFEMGDRPTEAWIDVITRYAPHAIIYLEIGMHAPTLALATFRLAPVQCVTWGHPQTSGLPTIDYFLSSDLMEPDDGETYYTETLVRLPNLSVSYTPLQTAPLTLDRSKLSATADDTLYISCQSIFKYLPEYDFIFPRIAELAPRGRFLFICRTLDPARRRFEERLARAFHARNLDYAKYVVFCQPLPFDQFAGFLRMGDVFLDSVGWSGCNTTLEALDVDLPVVTFPVGAMRGRHSGAILAMMGLSEGVAGSAEDYIVKAAALADPDRRHAYRERIRANKSRLFGDAAPIRGLEDFLQGAVSSAYTRVADTGAQPL